MIDLSITTAEWRHLSCLKRDCHDTRWSCILMSPQVCVMRPTLFPICPGDAAFPRAFPFPTAGHQAIVHSREGVVFSPLWLSQRMKRMIIGHLVQETEGWSSWHRLGMFRCWSYLQVLRLRPDLLHTYKQQFFFVTLDITEAFLN